MNTAPLARARARAKTSIEILRERDALEARQREVELALDTIEGEIDKALHHPEIAVMALCRIAAMVRRARGGALLPPESGVRNKSLLP